MRVGMVFVSAITFGLGLWGIYDEYFVFIEFIKGSMQPFTAVSGLVAILAGLLSRHVKAGHVLFGAAMLGLGVYGFFDEYFAVLDFFKGFVPPVLLLVGTVQVVSGVRMLR